MLPDGTYDAFVVDVADLEGGRRRLELTIVAGEHKGEALDVVATGLRESDFDLMGMPATLTVAAGEPSVVIDR